MYFLHSESSDVFFSVITFSFTYKLYKLWQIRKFAIELRWGDLFEVFFFFFFSYTSKVQNIYYELLTNH